MTSAHRFRVPLLTLLLAAATALPAATRLHARLTKSTPAADSALAASPKTIELWWSEKPEVGLTTVTLQGADSAKVGLSKLRPSADLFGVAADVTARLAAGKYLVTWKTAGKDGHAVRGSFTFSVAK